MLTQESKHHSNQILPDSPCEFNAEEAASMLELSGWAVPSIAPDGSWCRRYLFLCLCFEGIEYDPERHDRIM